MTSYTTATCRLAKAALAIALCSLAAACASPEYMQARELCANEWYAKIPPDYRQVLVNKTRRIKVPDGTETCTTHGNTTKCKQGMRSEWIPYIEAETVDFNEDARDAHIRQCALSSCLRTYGNAECKI